MLRLFGHMPMEEAPTIPLNNANPLPPDRSAAEDHEAVPSPGRNLPEPQALAHAIASIDDILAGAMHPKVDNKFTHEKNEQLQVDGEPPLGNKTPKDGINPFRPRDPTVGPNLSHRNKGMFFKRVAVTDSMFEPSDKGFVDISSDDHVASAGDLSLKQISEKYWAVKKGDEIILWVTKNPHGKWAAHDAHGYPLDKEEFNSVEEVLKHLLDLKQKQPEYDLHDPLVHHAALDDILDEPHPEETVMDESREVTRRNQINDILNNVEQRQEETLGLIAARERVPFLGETDVWGGTNGSLEEDTEFGPDGVHRDPWRNQSSKTASSPLDTAIYGKKRIIENLKRELETAMVSRENATSQTKKHRIQDIREKIQKEEQELLAFESRRGQASLSKVARFITLNQVAAWAEDEDSIDGGKEQEELHPGDPRFEFKAGIGDDAGGNSGLDGEDMMPLESIDAPQQQQGSRKRKAVDPLLVPNMMGVNGEVMIRNQNPRAWIPDTDDMVRGMVEYKRSLGIPGYEPGGEKLPEHYQERGHHSSLDDILMPERSIEGAPIEEGTGHLPVVNAAIASINRVLASGIDYVETMVEKARMDHVRDDRGWDLMIKRYFPDTNHHESEEAYDRYFLEINPTLNGGHFDDNGGHFDAAIDPTTQLGPDSEADEFMAHVASHKDKHLPGNFTKKHLKHLVDRIKESPKHEAHEYEADASDFTPDPLGSGDWTRPEGEGEPSQAGEQDMDILADGPQRDLGPNTEISTISVEEDDFGFEDSPSKKRADGFESPGDNDFITKGADDDPSGYDEDPGFDNQEGGNGFPMKDLALDEPLNPGTDDTNLKDPGGVQQEFQLLGHPGG